MNIAFFLTPKSEVVWVPLRATMRQALERMEYHRYSAVPLLDDEGAYVGTLTEGDLLWKMKSSPDLTFADTEHVPLADVPRLNENKAVLVTTDIEALLAAAADRNFVPVVDSRGVFMGIVRRKAIIEYCIERFARDRAHIDEKP
jgi:CBS domain-containing protein